MNDPANFPFAVLLVSFLALWISARLGNTLRNRTRTLDPEEHDDLNILLGATLTLLGLIIGFSFSLAISRYDQRKTYEEAEANAIGTEYVRADLLPSETARPVRQLLTRYLNQRILFYEARDNHDLKKIEAATAQLQSDLWSSIQTSVLARQTPVMALVVSGMNDVLNSEGYTQAAWWNRIPVAAWILLLIIAIAANLLLGYAVRSRKGSGVAFSLVLPLLLAISLFLIADIDSPRGGAILVSAQNLVRLSQSLKQ